MKKLLKKTLPWLACAAIFYYLFTKTHPREIWASLKLANITAFIIYSIAYFFFIHTVDCLTIKKFVSRFATPISHKETWIVRGVSYLIMVINYHAAQGAFAVYFKKTHKAPISTSLGTLAFISIMDLLLILTCAVVALFFTDVNYKGFDIRSFILSLAPLIYVAYFLWILFWRNTERPLIKRFKKYKIVHWFLKHDIFLIFREASLKDYLVLLAYRIPITVVVIGGYQLALMSYHSWINWVDMYLYNPIIMFIGTLPLTPSGLGTSQFLTVEFYKNSILSPFFAEGRASPASLLIAISLVWWFANQFIKMVFGIVCLSMTSKKLFVEDAPDNPVKAC